MILLYLGVFPASVGVTLGSDDGWMLGLLASSIADCNDCGLKYFIQQTCHWKSSFCFEKIYSQMFLRYHPSLYYLIHVTLY